MSQNWNKLPPVEITDNVFQLIGTDWMLITAGGIDRWNTMTASWGGLGVLWGKNVCFCFVRKSRYTYEFMNDSDMFSLTFFADSNREILNICGTKSGRDIDKAKETGLIPVELDGSVVFEQARMALVCRKLFCQDLDPGQFLDPSINNHYTNKDYHRMYIGEISGCYSR